MINALILGTTGMIGEGVLHQCLQDDRVSKVILVNRRPYGIDHPKVSEIILNDFTAFSTITDQLPDINACYFCMGVTSVGKNEDEYTRITYDLTLNIARLLLDLNRELTFIYVSGMGTDSTEQGRSMWARVKGKTENDILNLGFKDAYAFRPGFIEPIPGLKNANKAYRFIGFLAPVLRKLFPKYVTTLKEIGRAMIQVTVKPDNMKVGECLDIVRLGKEKEE